MFLEERFTGYLQKPNCKYSMCKTLYTFLHGLVSITAEGRWLYMFFYSKFTWRGETEN